LRSDEQLLVVDGVSKHFGGLQAVDEASFSVGPASITALIGPNGAGKTTVFNLLTGFIRADGGAVSFGGAAITGLKPHAIAKRGLVRTFQIPRVLTRMSVLENVMLAAPRQPGERMGAALFIPRRIGRREKEIHELAMEVLRLVRLDALAGDYAGTLSGGQRKLLEFGRVLMTDPRLILLDEPMAGVNPALGEQLLEHVVELRESRGIGFVFIEHDMDVVMSYAERVVVMDEGRVVADAPPDDVRSDPRVIEAYLGRHAEDVEEDLLLEDEVEVEATDEGEG
jgi:ABC-type branched-subunit amino acid transport system ATPase component